MLAIGVAIGLAGPGAISLDNLFGIIPQNPLLFLILAIVALLVDVVGLIISRPTPSSEAPTSPRASA